MALAAIATALVILTAAVYYPVARYGFVNFDDAQYVAQNPTVLRGLTLDGIRWSFTTGHAGNWHPLTWLSHMLDVTMFGANPSAAHLVNVALHAVNGVLLFIALWQMTSARWKSAIVAALFVVHPLHVESVAWIAERKDVLSACFWMCSLLAYVAYTRRPGLMRYTALVLTFALGLMAKPMVVTLPIVLLLLDAWPLQRQALGIRRLVLEKLPLVALAAASSIITVIVQRRAGAVRSLDALPFPYRLENAAVSVVRYLVKTIWPVNLSALYPYDAALTPALAAGAAALLIAGTIAVVRSRRPPAVTGWFWWLVMLVPVVGLIQVGSQSMADRYMYLPSIGVFIGPVWGASVALARRPLAAIVVTASVVLGLGVTASAQVRTWRDSETLWRHAIAVTGPNFRAHNNLAQALASTGDVDAAMNEYRTALSINPDSVEAHDGLGLALMSSGRAEEAIVQFVDATVLNGRYAPAHLHLATALASQGHFERAETEFSKVLELDPASVPARQNLALAQQAWGNALADRGEPAAALDHYDAALVLTPDSADLLDDRARALVALGRFGEAVETYTRAIALAPSNADLHFNRGAVLAKIGRRPEAIDEFRQVLALDSARDDAREALRRLGAGSG